MKPDTSGEATGKHPLGFPGCLGAARVNRSVEEPGRPGGMGAKPNCAWESITAYGFRWESERLIVAEKRVMTVERRGLAEEMWSQAAGEPIGSNAHYGGRLSGDATAGPSLARDRHSAKRPSKQLRMPAATSSGEPDAGNPHVRFDEGRGDIESPSYSTGSVTHAESARPEPSPDRKTSELIRQEETLASFEKSPQLSHWTPESTGVGSSTIAAGVDVAAP